MSIQRKQADDNGIEFTSEFPGIAQTPEIVGQGEHSPMICADEQRIIQIILNLQQNALKFTEEGSVTVSAQILSEEDGEFLQVSIADTGVGIRDEDKGKLFKLFGFLEDSE